MNYDSKCNCEHSYALRLRRAHVVVALALPCCFLAFPVLSISAPPTVAESASAAHPQEFRVLATKKTSTMDKEMNEAADAGFRFDGVMGGETAFGGSEVVVVMSRNAQETGESRFQYKLLATSKTSTMQKELQEAGDAGFEYREQTVFSSAFGGKEVVVILERDREATPSRFEYKLLATSKSSTMQKELSEAGFAGFALIGLTVSKTAMGGAEIVSILRRPESP